MTASGLQSLVVATAALLTVLVFVRAVWHKLHDVDSFAALVADYRLLPAWAVGGVARELIAAEAVIALSLLVPRLRDRAADRFRGARPSGGCAVRAHRAD